MINPSFIQKYSETIIVVLSSTETLSPRKEVLLLHHLKGKRFLGRIVETVSVDSQQCVMVEKKQKKQSGS